MASRDLQTLVRVTLSYGVGATALVILALIIRRSSSLKRFQQRLFASIFTTIGVPRLSAALDHHKSRLFARIHQMRSADVNLMKQGVGCVRILEIGVGSGTNLRYYPLNSHLIVVEPNPFFERLFKQNSDKYPKLHVEKFIAADAQDMSTAVDANSIDVVVSTHVLCSIHDVDKCLQEIKRILVPGGHFFYVEHVKYPLANKVGQALQTALNPMWMLFNDNCRLTQDLDNELNAAHFSSVHHEQLILDNVNFFIRPHLLGYAIK